MSSTLSKMSSSTDTAVVGGIATMDLTHSSHQANNQTNQTSPSHPHSHTVTVQHIDEAAASVSSGKGTNGNGNVTLVATPKTMGWTAIIVLLSLGIMGLVFVLVYSIVKPGSGSSK